MRDEIPRHQPVLHTTVLEILAPRSGETVLDVTLGLAGHAVSFAAAIGKGGTFIGIDADGDNLALARQRLAEWPGTLVLHHVNFLSLPELSLPPVDIVFADLGLSSPHVDMPERGFTFRAEGPLDLRYDRSSGETAADLIERLDAYELRIIFRRYGELDQATRLSEALAGKRWPTTTSLRDEVEAQYGFLAKSILPQVFQALRIAVNRELEAVEVLLAHGPLLLKPGGRLGIISYHSLEDRLVKHAFRSLMASEKDPITGQVSVPAPFASLTPKLIVPSPDELTANPRSRSAKFRAITRLPS